MLDAAKDQEQVGRAIVQAVQRNGQICRLAIDYLRDAQGQSPPLVQNAKIA
jgi:hypothetical protein